MTKEVKSYFNIFKCGRNILDRLDLRINERPWSPHKARAVDVSSNRKMECTPPKCFRCGYEDHMIAKFPKAPKDNGKRRNQVRFNEKGNSACDNSEDNYDHKIYASMA